MRTDAVPNSHGADYHVKQARADITDKTQDVEHIPAIWFVDMPVHHHAQHKHEHDGEHEQQPANPLFLNEVSSAVNQPSHNRGGHRHGGHRSLVSGSSFFLLFG